MTSGQVVLTVGTVSSSWAGVGDGERGGGVIELGAGAGVEALPGLVLGAAREVCCPNPL